MSDTSKITADHLRRCAFVYVRQSSAAQVEHNRESTERQYRLVDRAVELGWTRQQVNVIDDDLGVSGAGLARRLLSRACSKSALVCPSIPTAPSFRVRRWATRNRSTVM